MIRLIVITALGVAVYAISWLAWKLVGRPIIVALSLLPLTALDYLILAWKAEQECRWADAMAAYDEAIALNPENRQLRRVVLR